MAATIHISLNHRSYIRDPESTELGKKIISESAKLIDELGFEDFTFKKLALRIGSTEASIYRYFENKHKLLVYLVSWYWAWMHYSVVFQVQNIADPRERLSRAIEVIIKGGQVEDERILHRVIVAESSKVYHTKEVDIENQASYFMEIKEFCDYLAHIVLEINPDYRYPHAIISTILEAANQQTFYAQHLPSLTDIGSQEYTEIINFLKQIVFATVNNTFSYR